MTANPGERKPIVMIAAMVLLFAGIVAASILFSQARPKDAAGPLRVSLRGMVAIGNPPQLVRAFQSGQSLTNVETLILRAQLSRAAHVHLLAQRPGAAAEPIWPAADDSRDAGDLEIGEGDRPLQLAQSLFPAGATLCLLACEKAPANDSLRTSIQLTPENTAAAFPGCANALLTLGASH